MKFGNFLFHILNIIYYYLVLVRCLPPQLHSINKKSKKTLYNLTKCLCGLYVLKIWKIISTLPLFCRIYI